MVSRKLIKPATVAAAAAIAAGGAYAASGALPTNDPAAAQIGKAGVARGDAHAPRRGSAAAIGLARDFGISRAAARQLIDSTYR